LIEIKNKKKKKRKEKKNKGLFQWIMLCKKGYIKKSSSFSFFLLIVRKYIQIQNMLYHINCVVKLGYYKKEIYFQYSLNTKKCLIKINILLFKKS